MHVCIIIVCICYCLYEVFSNAWHDFSLCAMSGHVCVTCSSSCSFGFEGRLELCSKTGYAPSVCKLYTAMWTHPKSACPPHRENHTHTYTLTHIYKDTHIHLPQHLHIPYENKVSIDAATLGWDGTPNSPFLLTNFRFPLHCVVLGAQYTAGWEPPSLYKSCLGRHVHSRAWRIFEP